MKKFFRKNGKWFVLSLYVFINGLILFEASLSGGASGLRSQIVASIFGDIINVATPPREPDYVAVESVTFSTSDNKTLNNDDHYFIPIGITRRLIPSFNPVKPTNTGITYASSNEDVVRATQSGRLEARTFGENIEITATIADNNTIFSFYVSVVPKAAPTEYIAELRDKVSSLPLYSSSIIDVFIKRNNEYERADLLFNHEYDLTKLSFYSEDESIATVNKYGVISTHQVGATFVGITGNNDARFAINVTAETATVADDLTFLSITDDPLPYYIYQKTALNPTFLKDGAIIDEALLSDRTLTIVSSNEAIASVYYDKDSATHYLYGTKLAGTATINIFLNSNFRLNIDYTPDFSFNIDVTEVLPTSISLAETDNTNAIGVGKSRTIKALLSYDQNVLPEGLEITNQDITYRSSNNEIATVTSQGTNGVVLARKTGTVTITAESVADNTVKASITFEIVPLPFINDQNFGDFHAFIRKAIGHFSLFFVNGVLGFFTFLMFTQLSDKTKALISLSIGLFVAALSEFIQIFVERAASLTDVMLNFSGYLAATLLFYLIFFYYKKRPKKVD